MNFHHDSVAATVRVRRPALTGRKAHRELSAKPDREPQSPEPRSVQTRVSWSGVVRQSPLPITDY